MIVCIETRSLKLNVFSNVTLFCLLEREYFMNQFTGKKILVTGGMGSIGSEIVRSLLKYKPLVIRVYDNNEHQLFNLLSLCAVHKNLRPLLGDIRDVERLRKAMNDIDIVFHAAGLKHVEMSEYNPFEAVKTNILGTQNVIDTAMKENVEKVIFISTDKVVNPSSTMGATKLVAERLISSTYYHQGNNKTKFGVVRFGNVLFSAGSVLPVWTEQISHGQPLTITDNKMTRFIMPVQEAVGLVFQAASLVKNGETFILKMPSVNIKDLATAFIQLTAPKQGINPDKVVRKIIGIRSGEKMSEELIAQSEATNLYETNSMYIVVPFQEILRQRMKKQKYSFRKVKNFSRYSSASQKPLTIPQITALLKKAM